MINIFYHFSYTKKKRILFTKQLKYSKLVEPFFYFSYRLSMPVSSNLLFSGPEKRFNNLIKTFNKKDYSYQKKTYQNTYIVQFDSFGVGTAASGTTGEIRATNDVTAFYSSDVALKENITNIPDPIESLKKLNGVLFDWKKEYIDQRGGEDGYFVRKKDVGVIAQEVEKVLPEAVAQRPDGIKAVKYDRLTCLLIEAVKKLSTQVEVLSKKES